MGVASGIRGVLASPGTAMKESVTKYKRAYHPTNLMKSLFSFHQGTCAFPSLEESNMVREFLGK